MVINFKHLGFRPMDTTTKLKIKPKPFISFSILNNLTSPKDVLYNVDVDNTYEWLIVEKINTSNFIIDESLKQNSIDNQNAWMELKPNKTYEATVSSICFWSINN